MSGAVLKLPAGSRAARYVAPPPPGAGPYEPPPPDPASARIAGLEARVLDLETLLAEREAALEPALAAARAEARSAALEEAEDDAEARLAALREALALAQQGFAARLADLDKLAPALARRALERVFDPSDARGETVAMMLARQLDAARALGAVTVRVSAADFADEAALVALSDGLSTPAVAVRQDDGLPSGACRIDLTMGAVDLSVADQWRRVAELLDAMTGPEP